MRTSYLLESVDIDNRSGVLKIKPELPKNAPWQTIKVRLSGLLASRITLRRFDGLSKPDELVGTKFTSTVNSKEFGENPFTLTKFVPTGKSDIPVNYILSLVIERYSPKEEVSDALGNRFNVIRRWRETRPNYFLRFMEVKTTSMMAVFPKGGRGIVLQ